MSRASPDPLPVQLSLGECEELASAFDIEGLQLTIQGRVVVLEGLVPCYRLKKQAEDAVARRVGLRVANRLRVVPHSHRQDAQLLAAVQASLATRAVLAGEEIVVTAREGVVTLCGQVSSLAARCEAERAAWAAGGMTDVENLLAVRAARARNGGLQNHRASLGAGSR